MRKILILIITIMALQSCKEELENGIYAKIETTKGDIILKLEHEKTPMTVANFVGLAEGKIANTSKKPNDPYYDGLKFHRVIENFMIQGGDPTGTGTSGPGYSFADEFSDELTHKKGTLSMANSGPGTNGSQFFITHIETPWLDGKHTVFGYVTDSLSQSVVDKIEQNDIMKKVSIIRIGSSAKSFDAKKVFEQKKSEIADKIKNKQQKYATIEKDFVKKSLALLSKGETLSSGLKFAITEKGNGAKPNNGDNIKVHYAGYLESGKLFDSSYKEVAKERGVYDAMRDKQGGYNPFKTVYGPTAQLIEGFKVALEKMSIGDKAIVYIPSKMGYGSRGAGGAIPPNSNLIFVLEIVK